MLGTLASARTLAGSMQGVKVLTGERAQPGSELQEVPQRKERTYARHGRQAVHPGRRRLPRQLQRQLLAEVVALASERGR